MRFWCKTDSEKYNLNLEKRFFQKVKKTEKCWEWVGSKINGNYGQFKVRNVNILAHRVSYKISFGVFDESMDVLHMCDNPSCVNPKHLFLGNHKDNMADKTKKGRTPSKLAKKDIAGIRNRIKKGESLCSIGKIYGVGHHAIGDIRDGITWSHVSTM